VINEAEMINNIKAKVDTVSPQSTWADARIKAALSYLAQLEGKKESVIKDEIDAKAAKFSSIATKAPILYHSIQKNIIEQELFKRYSDARKEGQHADNSGPQFSPVLFSKLVRRVKAENRSIFPLRNYYNKKPIISPRIILIPGDDEKDNKQFKDVDTAAATGNGEFIFNVPFMQTLLNFAHAQKIKPKSKKYEANGGEFPNEYSTLEFLILHEFYHYTHGDFHHMKVMGGSPLIHNWTGDFRSNYDLTKAGHQPLPMGLFNDLINYDRQLTYREMYELVKSEFDKLTKPQQKQVEQQLGDLTDDHIDSDNQEDPRTGEAPSESDMENHSKKTSKAAGEHEDGAQDGPDPKTNTASKGGQGNNSGARREVQAVKPRYNWRALLDRLMRSSDTTETTYQKVHRRNITSIDMVQKTGAAAVKPGEVVVPAQKVKLCLVIDSSGSMGTHIDKVLANAREASKQSSVAKTFIVCEFSDDYTFYRCTVSGSGGSAIKLKSASEADEGGGGTSFSLDHVFKEHQGGATNFTDDLAGQLEILLRKKYNVIVMSDSDMAEGANFATLKKLIKGHPSQFGAIFDGVGTYDSIVRQLGMGGALISHF
jgi:hypothetical protein